MLAEIVCKTHGLTTHVVRSDRNGYRCRKCSVDHVAKKRIKRKLQCIEYKGGCCEKCGYNKCVDALDFHHIGEKNFEIGTGAYAKAWPIVQAELDLCQLLCANCHREVHWEMNQP